MKQDVQIIITKNVQDFEKYLRSFDSLVLIAHC